MRLGQYLGRALLVFPWQWTARIAIALALAILLPTEARSADPEATVKPVKGKGTVALIDLQHAIEHHPGFRQAKEELGTEAKLAEVLLALRKASIDKLQQDIRHDAAQGDRLGLPQVFSEEMAALKLEVERHRQELLRREADLYRQAYQHVQETVDDYMAQHGLSLVLRFSRAAADDASDPQEVAKLLNRPIVAYKSAVDITDEVVRRLEKGPALRMSRRPAAVKSAQ
jgi:Skp family chaperone for outer membrane proteins